MQFLYFQMHRIETSDEKEAVTRLMGETLKRMEQISRRKSFQLENIFSGGTTRSPTAYGSCSVVTDSESQHNWCRRTDLCVRKFSQNQCWLMWIFNYNCNYNYNQLIPSYVFLWLCALKHRLNIFVIFICTYMYT